VAITIQRSHAMSGAWTAVIALLLLMPLGRAPRASDWIPQFVAAASDKIVHAVLFFAAARAYQRSAALIGFRRPGIAAVSVAVAYGGGMEILQSFVGRDAEWGDLAADALGAVIAAAWAQRGRQHAPRSS
jgi:VanZ family protein